MPGAGDGDFFAVVAHPVQDLGVAGSGFGQILIPVVRPPFSDRLRRAVAAWLARLKGPLPVHTESDLRSYVTWCEARGPDPLSAHRSHIELYGKWIQEVRRH